MKRIAFIASIALILILALRLRACSSGAAEHGSDPAAKQGAAQTEDQADSRDVEREAAAETQDVGETQDAGDISEEDKRDPSEAGFEATKDKDELKTAEPENSSKLNTGSDSKESDSQSVKSDNENKEMTSINIFDDKPKGEESSDKSDNKSIEMTSIIIFDDKPKGEESDSSTEGKTGSSAEETTVTPKEEESEMPEPDYPKAGRDIQLPIGQ